MEQLPYYTLVPAEVALYVNVQMSTMSCVCRCARIMQMHIPMIAEVKVFQRKTCFKCLLITIHENMKIQYIIKKIKGRLGNTTVYPRRQQSRKSYF